MRQGPRGEGPAFPPLSAGWKSYSICIAFLELFEKIHALTAGLMAPFAAIVSWQQVNAAPWIVSISASATIRMRSSLRRP